MTAREKRYYLDVYKTLTSKKGSHKLSDEQAIDAMSLTEAEYDMILERIYQ